MNEAKVAFFDRIEQQGLALTFDDVRLRTSANPDNPLPDPLDISSRFSRNVELNTPFVSAAMDTVTESRMAISMAELGGLGVLHAALSPQEQKAKVRTVKYANSGLIPNPKTVNETDSLQEVINRCETENYHFRTFPVIDNNGKFVGLITGRTFRYRDEDSTKTVSELMTPSDQVVKAPANVEVDEAYTLMTKEEVNTLPLINGDGSVKGLYIYDSIKRSIRANDSTHNVDSHHRLRVAAAVPTNESAIERVKLMRGSSDFLDVVVLDSADGDSYWAFRTLDELKSEFPDLDVVVGNISDGESARMLAEAGADGIKVGQGPGSICTTRIETGIGKPQVSAIYECASAVEDLDVPLCADGGIRNHGDISIAIAAGAHTVMMGKMLAGTEEAAGEKLTGPDGRIYKKYRGMASPSSIKDGGAAARGYVGASEETPLPEGVDDEVHFRGPVESVIKLCKQALIKSMKYTKSRSLDDHRKNAQLFRVTNSGMIESMPHIKL